jgi:UDP-N-acetylmuramate--alanine ligase
MHGKSTTTAMIGLMLEKAGLDPTVIVGTRLREWGNSNFRAGKGRYLVIEADEYDRSFLNYWPKVLVLLNIEEKHLDTYTEGLADIMATFGKYLSHLPAGGVLVANGEDENVEKLLGQMPVEQFKIERYNSDAVSGLNLKVPGRHNISNANAALAVARILGIDEKIAIESLNNFSGAWRRMEYKGEINGAKVFDDYGHHPTEIAATLSGAKELVGRNGKLWCVFQPHQYHRTFDLFDKFVSAFGAADKVVLLPIYSVAGREDEEIKKQVSSERLTLRLQAQGKKEDVVYKQDFNKTEAYLKESLQVGDVCLIMGAGDIYKLTNLLIKA